MLKQRPTIRDHSAEANLFARRAFVGFVFVLGLVAVLLTNLYKIQVEDHQDYQTRSNDNRIKVIPISPFMIYVRNLKKSRIPNRCGFINYIFFKCQYRH